MNVVQNNFLRIENNNDVLMISFEANISNTYILEKTINLKDWNPVKTYRGIDPINYKLNSPLNSKQEYYRIRLK